MGFRRPYPRWLASGGVRYPAFPTTWEVDKTDAFISISPPRTHSLACTTFTPITMKLAALLSLLTASQLNLVAAQRKRQTVGVIACRDEERHDCFHEEYSPRGLCHNLSFTLNDKITGFDVGRGCCSFYRHYGCNKEDFLFSAFNRAHSRLPPYDNDIISSLRCWLGEVST